MSGSIPVEVAQLKALKVLKLNGNQLSGECAADGACRPSDHPNLRFCASLFSYIGLVQLILRVYAVQIVCRPTVFDQYVAIELTISGLQPQEEFRKAILT